MERTETFIIFSDFFIQLPNFLSYIGILEINNWEKNKQNRVNISQKLISTISETLGSKKFNI